MDTREWVFDRIEQSFELLVKNINNFWKLILPFFIYKLVFTIFIWNFISFVLLWNIWSSWMDIFSNPFYGILFFLILLWFLLYFIFIVWFIIYSIKSIKDLYEWKDINIKENLEYWFKSIMSSFNTYRYIFKYIAIIPSAFIIFWWLIFIFWDYLHNDFRNIWLYLVWFWFFILLISMIYRWVKTYLSLNSAVDSNEYTQENFNISVKITDWNWWRVVWNYILIWIIISLIISIFSWILWLFSTWITDIIDFKTLIYKYTTWWITSADADMIKENIKNYYNSFYLNNFLISIVDLFITNIKEIFMLTFTYVLYKRLIFEQSLIKSNINLTNNKKIEL